MTEKDDRKVEKKRPGTDNSPHRGGYSHADTRMGHEHSEMLGEFERTVTQSEKPKRDEKAEGADALSRTKK